MAKNKPHARLSSVTANGHVRTRLDHMDILLKSSILVIKGKKHPR